MPSTAINRMHYDAKKHVLRIVFVSGMVYDYKKVPPKVYDEMKAAPSKGEYLNYHIKKKYPYEKVG
ncbi:MAG TPA: KTSC domain-containing protein [Puia sp.]